MPSSRAVLVDITDKGLKPHVAHSVVGSNGRLRAPSVGNTNKQSAPSKTEQPLSSPVARRDEELVVEEKKSDPESATQPKEALRFLEPQVDEVSNDSHASTMSAPTDAEEEKQPATVAKKTSKKKPKKSKKTNPLSSDDSEE